MKKMSWLFLILVLLFQIKPAFSDETTTKAPPEKMIPKEAARDTNDDGKPDRWEYYDEKGNVIRAESDADFDGKVDEWGYFENGKLKKVAKDTKHAGKPDTWVSY